jgi:hypothetical protein
VGAVCHRGVFDEQVELAELAANGFSGSGCSFVGIEVNVGETDVKAFGLELG